MLKSLFSIRFKRQRCGFIFAALILLGQPRLDAAPDWTTNPAALGSADIEGQLALALPMGPAAGSAPEFNLQLQLVHTTTKIKLKLSERDARIDLLRKAAGLPPLDRSKPTSADASAANKANAGASNADAKVEMFRSGWVIPQLISYLYPANRDRLIWRPPGGGEVIFTREEMDAKRYAPEGYFCAETSPGVYRISDREGWAWVYKEGLPATLTAPSGRFLEFTHEQGLLTRVVQRLSVRELGTNQDVLRITRDSAKNKSSNLLGLEVLSSVSDFSHLPPVNSLIASLAGTPIPAHLWRFISGRVPSNEQRRPLRVVAGTLEHRLSYDKLTGHLLAWNKA